jgi:4-hydroxybenzoate polyprenyltransferase
MRDAAPSSADYARQLRWHQWFKNVLLFAPILGAHAWTNLDAILSAIAGFFAFSLCASSTYIVNDLFDLAADRRHPTKRQRPLAAGRISIGHAVVVSAALLALGIAIAASLGSHFFAYAVAYITATLAYSLRLKALVLVDAVTLASLYTLRVMAGGAATGIPISFWLLALSVFLFFSLALVKRWSELQSLLGRGELAARGRDYRVTDLPLIGAMGVASGYISVAVLALYIQSTEVSLRYSRPEILWILCLIMLYWISRMWIKAGRGEMNEDPLLYTLRDRASLLLVAIGAVAVFMATYS